MRQPVSQRLSEVRARGQATAAKQIAEAVANDIFRRRSEELAEDVAKQMSAAYQTSLDSMLKGITDAIAEGMGEIETALQRLSERPDESLGPLGAIDKALGDLKTSVEGIEIPSPEVTIPSSLAVASGGRDYDLQIERDENGFISGVKARAVE